MLALSHCEVLKAEIDYVGTDKKGKPIVKKSGQSVFRRDIMPSQPQRDGEISILVATQKEKDSDPKFNDYVLA